MLCQADANLVGRDPGLPGLAMILDPDAFLETLQGLYPDAGVTAAEPSYVRYKPTTSCLVGYRVSCAAGTVDVYARAHNSDGVNEIVDAFEAVQGGGNGVLHRGFVRAISLNRQSLAVARIVRRRAIDRSNAGAGLAE